MQHIPVPCQRIAQVFPDPPQRGIGSCPPQAGAVIIRHDAEAIHKAAQECEVCCTERRCPLGSWHYWGNCQEQLLQAPTGQGSCRHLLFGSWHHPLPSMEKVGPAIEETLEHHGCKGVPVPQMDAWEGLQQAAQTDVLVGQAGGGRAELHLCR